MGNANGREEARPDDGRVAGAGVDDSLRSNGEIAPGENRAPVRCVTRPTIPTVDFPVRFLSPMLISQQVPIAPLQKSDGSVSLCQIRESDSLDSEDPKQGIPVIITWNYGGNDVLIEGSWDNWISRKRMQRSGNDCSILLVLPAGIYNYKFIVDGEYRYVPELPHISDDSGHICNLLDVDDYVPEYPESIAEFEAPPSPESSYSQVLWAEEDFAKEPLVTPPQLQLTVLGPANAEEQVPSRPQHVVLNHLFIHRAGPSQSVGALGLTHRFESKYVTVVLYKPVRR